jgi:UPF0716 protein FxsA
MRLALLLVGIALPLLELGLLIKVGQLVGLWPTLLWAIASAIAGVLVIRRQGLGILARLMEAADRQVSPLQPAVEGALTIGAGVLLLLPGLLTDLAGLLLLVEPVRRLVSLRIVRYIVDSPHVVVRARRWQQASGPGDDSEPPPRRPGPVIEGEFERIDEPKRGDRSRND